VVVTNRADPLSDEGSAFADKLQQAGADCLHLQHGGSHHLGTVLNSKAADEVVQAWLDRLYCY
jgi:acetyl esterase/lipase